jgi:large subunit ribosomal protein L30
MAKKKSSKVRITLKKSLIGRKPQQRRTVKALGLGKIGSSVEQEKNPSIEGMIHAVSHLVVVEEL